MAKKEIKFCKECQRQTRQICVKKDKMKLTEDEIIFSIFNLGMYPIVKRILDTADGNAPAKYWECQRCGNITKL